MEIIIYLFTTILIIFIFIIFTIKMNNPFWSLMPVYHSYDYWRYLYRNNFIFNEIPRNRYFDLLQIETIEFNELSQENIENIVRLLQNHFLGNDNLLYTIEKTKLLNSINGCNSESMISLYKKQKYDVIDSEIKIINSKDIDAFIISKRIDLCIFNNYKYHNYDCFTMEHLCSHRDETNGNLKRKLLFTHLHNCLNNKPINAFIFKKEYNLFSNVIPLVEYNSYTYNITNTRKYNLPALIDIQKITNINLDKLLYALHSMKSGTNKIKFDVIIHPNIGNIRALIDNDIIEIYTLTYKQHILAYYVFKNNFIHFEKEDAFNITLISSINNCPNNELFFNGFYNVFSNILKNFPNKNILTIENNSHNSTLINNLNIYYSPISIHKVAYYSINLFVANSPIYSCFSIY